MTTPAIIVGSLVALVWLFWEDFREWRNARHNHRLQAEQAEKERRADELIARQQRIRDRADGMRPWLDELDLMALQLQEIRGLPERVT